MGDKPHCGSLETRMAYTEGAKYALTKLTSHTDATVYIDAGHGGWLGWHNNLMKFVETLKGLNVPFDKIRGFSTNVAAYQPLGHMCPWQPDSTSNPYRNGFCLNARHQDHICCADACGLLPQFNPAQNELNYAQELHHAAVGEMGMDAHIIIDTGRNGVPEARSDCANWCINRGAGAGYASSAHTEGAGIVDAYFYLKTPGESDGCTETLPDGTSCPRFDVGCGSPDAIGSQSEEPRAPEAGKWFDYQVKQLAELADFGSSAQPPRRSTTRSPVLPQPAPTVRAAPLPPTPPQSSSTPELEPAKPGSGSCCWDVSCSAPQSCAPSSSWCAQSEGQCVGKCSGLWCPAAPPVLSSSLILSGPQSSQVRRHRSLRARPLQIAVENMMLQRFSMRTGSIKAEGDMARKDEL